MEAYNEILKKIHASTLARLTKNGIGKSPIDLNSLLKKLFLLIKSDAYKLNQDKAPVVFVFDSESEGTGESVLNEDFLNTFFNRGKYSVSNVIYLDYSARLVKPNPYEKKRLLNIIEITEDYDEDETLKSNYLYVFVIRDEVIFIHKKIVVDNIPDIWSHDRRGELKGRFKISEYRTIVNSHHKTELVGERGLKYWDNKLDWRLVKGPEEQFRKRLMHFIEQNISGAKVDEECMSNGDRTDIRMIELASGDIYIIEVKWMGKSTGADIDKQLAHDKANEGIYQLHTYLSQESKSVCGLLVMYDARKEKFDIIWNPDKNEWDERIDKEPIIPSLEPTSASSKAKKEVKESRLKGKK